MERILYLIKRQQQLEFEKAVKNLEKSTMKRKKPISDLELIVIWTAITSLVVPFICILCSYPTSYLVEYTLSGVNKCRVQVNSPLTRTGLGFVGAAAGGAGIYLPLLARIIESVNPGDWRDLPPCE